MAATEPIRTPVSPGPPGYRSTRPTDAGRAAPGTAAGRRRPAGRGHRRRVADRGAGHRYPARGGPGARGPGPRPPPRLRRHDRDVRRRARRPPALLAELADGPASWAPGGRRILDRHPATVVRPETAPRLLTDLHHRIELLGGDRCRRVLRAALRRGALAAGAGGLRARR